MNFFKKKNKEDSQITQLTSEVGNLCLNISGLEAKIDGLAKMSGDCATTLYKLDKRQKEVSLQLDDISEAITDDSGTQSFIDALIALADQIEHFYLFTQEDTLSPLYTQSAMMWNSAKKNLEEAGIDVIDNCEVPLDTTIHSIQGTDFDRSLPNGYVIKVLSCGYVYNGEVIRRASIIVNKANNIITLEKRENENI